MEVKEEITQIIDTLPIGVLDELLVYLKQVEKVPHEKFKRSLDLKAILIEDKELLERLAK